jgi:hypothetical protein
MFHDNKTTPISNHQHGVAIVETLLVFPLIILMGFGIVQLAVIWQAKSALNYGAFMAARRGALTSMDIDAMKTELNDAVAGVFDPDVDTDFDSSKHTFIRILNPTSDAFTDFGGPATASVACVDALKCEIPNSQLQHREMTVGTTSFVNIQDANLLRIEAIIGFKPNLPMIGPVFQEIIGHLGSSDTIKNNLFAAHRIPLRAIYTIHMQSPPRLTASNSASVSSQSSVKAMIGEVGTISGNLACAGTNSIASLCPYVGADN